MFVKIDGVTSPKQFRRVANFLELVLYIDDLGSLRICCNRLDGAEFNYNKTKQESRFLLLY